MTDQILDWVSYRPGEHIPEWFLVSSVAVSLIIWSAITLILVVTPHKRAWMKSGACESAMDCKYILFLLPWGLGMVPLGLLVLLFGVDLDHNTTDDLLIRFVIVFFAVFQAAALGFYHFGSHKHT